MINHCNYLQRKIVEFPLLASFKIRRLIFPELLGAARWLVSIFLLWWLVSPTQQMGFSQPILAII